MKRPIKCIEIFSGAGGLAKGLEIAGAEHVALVEWNKTACSTLMENFSPEIVHNTDIRKFSFAEYDDVDILAGGPPCQPFSMGGKARGESDERDMFPQAIAALRSLAPKAFIFENVKGLLRPTFRTYFDYILHQLMFPSVIDTEHDFETHLNKLKQIEISDYMPDLAYDVKFKLIDAADYGIPQNRERVLIVGIRKDLNIDWDFPTQTHSKLSLNWSKYVSGDYWRKHHIDMMHSDSITVSQYGLFPPAHLPWQTIRDVTCDLPKPTIDSCDPVHRIRQGAKEYPKHTGSEIDSPSKTIKAGVHGVPGGENMIKFTDGSVRYFTIGEAKRIQTFPDDYSIAGSWSDVMKQLGNAVPVKLAEIIGSSVINTLSNSCMQ